MTEAQMFEHLRAMYPANEYALVPQVRNGTGFAKSPRTADAIAISLWPSRGIDMIGFEFKDSRADVLKELKDPAKSDEIGKHCRFWWMVVSDPKWISKDELPSGWGLIAIKDGGIKKIVPAPSRDAIKPDLPLIAAILKSAQGVVTGENEIQRRIAEAVRKAQEESHKSHQADLERREKQKHDDPYDLRKAYAKFKQQTGIDIVMDDRYSQNLGKAVRFVLDGGIDNLERIVSWCDKLSREAKQLLGEPECHS